MIYFDGSAILRRADGVGRYAREIFTRIPGARLLTFSNTDDYGHDVVRLPFPEMPYRTLSRLFGTLPVDAFLQEKPSVLVYPNFVRFPLVRQARCISVIHDLAFLKTPQYLSTGNRAYLRRFVPQTIREADTLVTSSETVKRQIIEEYEVADRKVIVAPCCVDASRFENVPAAATAAIRNKLNIAGEYFLFVGTIEPRKNILGLLNAYEQLGTASPTLVLAGGPGWKNAAILSRISALQSTGFDIVVSGFVADTDLPALYAGATLLILPSHYEGFGIPILEAQAAGTPVITSARNPMMEVAGDAALFVDPDDIAQIAAGMSSLHANTELQAELVGKGHENVRRFHWDQSAAIILQAIGELAR